MQLPGRLAVAALISGEPGHTLRVYGVALGDSAANIGGNDGSERDVSFAADGGTVSRIYLSEKCFTGIHWHTPEDVVASLGPPDLIERGDRNSRLTFPNLSLVVFLNHQTREATATIMDVARVGPRRYSVRDLLNEMLSAPWLVGAHTPDHRTARARRKRAELLASELAWIFGRSRAETS